VYLDGGVTIQRFIQEGLVNELTLTTIPILIGEGLPLFGALKKDVPLELIHATSFINGFVQKKYKFPT
jgi:dihydrofolate reductase